MDSFSDFKWSNGGGTPPFKKDDIIDLVDTTALQRPMPLPGGESPPPLRKLTPTPVSSNDDSNGPTQTVASQILNPQGQAPSPTRAQLMPEFQRLVPNLDEKTVTHICKIANFPPLDLLNILKKITAYEEKYKEEYSSGSKNLYINRDPELNKVNPDNIFNKVLTDTFDTQLKNSLAYVDGEWLILLKEKGDTDNLKIKGGFNKATLGINPKTGDIKVTSTGLFIDNPTSLANSSKESDVYHQVNRIIDTEGPPPPPFLKTNILFYNGKAPQLPPGKTYTIKKSYTCQDSNNNSVNIYQKILRVMDYCSKGNVEILLKQNKLTPAQKLTASKTLAYGVALLHKNGIIHGDLKPGNMVQDANDKFYLIDFNLSNQIDKFRTGGGTTGYKAFVDLVFSDDNHTGISFDLFSLGVSLSQLNFDNKIVTLNIKYRDKQKSVNNLIAYRNELNVILKDYEKMNPELTRILKICLETDTDKMDFEGEYNAQWVHEQVEKL